MTAEGKVSLRNFGMLYNNSFEKSVQVVLHEGENQTKSVSSMVLNQFEMQIAMTDPFKPSPSLRTKGQQRRMRV